MAPPEAKSQECRFPRDKRGQGRRRGVFGSRGKHRVFAKQAEEMGGRLLERCFNFPASGGVCKKMKRRKEARDTSQLIPHFPLALLGVLLTDMSFSAAANEECRLTEYCGYYVLYSRHG